MSGTLGVQSQLVVRRCVEAVVHCFSIESYVSTKLSAAYPYGFVFASVLPDARRIIFLARGSPGAADGLSALRERTAT